MNGKNKNLNLGDWAFLIIGLGYIVIAILPLVFVFSEDQKANLDGISLLITFAAGIIAILETLLKFLIFVLPQRKDSFVKRFRVAELIVAIIICFIYIIIVSIFNFTLDFSKPAGFMTVATFSCFFFNLILDEKSEEQRTADAEAQEAQNGVIIKYHT